MTRIRCRHCKAPVDLGEDEDGLTCPKCGRYPPRREPPKAALPPPASEAARRPPDAGAAGAGCLAALALAASVGMVVIGLLFAAGAFLDPDRPRAVTWAGLAVFAAVVARVFQAVRTP